MLLHPIVDIWRKERRSTLYTIDLSGSGGVGGRRTVESNKESYKQKKGNAPARIYSQREMKYNMREESCKLDLEPSHNNRITVRHFTGRTGWQHPTILC